MAGILTVAIMVLPTVLRTTEEALLAVPDSFREGSFGLGAGKLRTVFRIVLPSAIPGILSGVILSKTASTQTAAKRSGKRQMLLPLISALMAGLKASFRKMTWALWSQVMWQ